MKLVWDKAPTEDNGRNSEGSFIRIPDGSIMFAYSRYSSASAHDHANCDIAAIYSQDEGEIYQYLLQGKKSKLTTDKLLLLKF